MTHSLYHKGIVILIGALAAGCSLLDTDSSDLLACYKSHDEEGLYIAFGEDSIQSFVRVYDQSGEPPLTTYGTFQGEDFVYADGSSWIITELSAIGQGGLIEGIEVYNFDCSNLL